ncbi:MAG: hypothetical protein JWO68_3136, partial [Actinomycetia bacterium]|nr:hypothetical protein [Actinomycetes bacterium]
TGAARDLRTGIDVVVAGAARLTAAVAPDRRLASLAVEPDADVAALVGATLGRGYRRRLAELLPGGLDTPLGLLLDDLPVAALLAEYVPLRRDSSAGRGGARSPASAADRMADLCSGWRSGGTLLPAGASGAGVPLQDCPPARSLLVDADPLAWHAIEPVAPATMRRWRRIDVHPGDTIEVDAMFRDSHGDPDGTEVVLHEYRVELSVAPGTLEILRVRAEPRVLPYDECPAAAAGVDRLVGLPATELRTEVGRRLAGIVGCTHLNDLLRSLGALPGLL